MLAAHRAIWNSPSSMNPRLIMRYPSFPPTESANKHSISAGIRFSPGLSLTILSTIVQTLFINTQVEIPLFEALLVRIVPGNSTACIPGRLWRDMAGPCVLDGLKEYRIGSKKYRGILDHRS